MTNEIKIIEKEIAPVIKIALGIKIKKAEDMTRAAEVLSQLNQFNDKIVAEREKVTKPLNEALKAERARWKPIESANEEAIKMIRVEMSAYQTTEIKRIKDEESKIASRIAPGKGNLSFETGIKKIEAIERVDNKVVVESGSIKFREDKVLKIVDPMKIPREYLTVNEALILKDLKSGKNVAGAELEIKMTPINNR